MKKSTVFQKKLKKAFVYTIGIMITVVVALLFLVVGLLYEMRGMQQESMKLTQITKEARENNLNSQIAMYRRCLSDEETERKKYMAQADAYDLKLQQNLKYILTERPNLKTEIVSVQNQIEEAFPKKSAAVLMSISKPSQEVILYLEKEYFPIMTKIDTLLDQMNVALVSDIEYRNGVFTLISVAIGILVIIFTISCAIMAVKKSRSIREDVSQPLTKLWQSMEHLSKGDLTYDIEVGTEDEFGQLIEMTNFMKDELRKYIDNIDYVLSEISIGNLNVTIDIDYMGSFDHIKSSMQKILVNMSSMLTTVDGTSRIIQQRAGEFHDVSDQLELTAGKQKNFSNNLNLVSNQLRNRVVTSTKDTQEVNTKAHSSKELIEQEKVCIKNLLEQSKKMSLASANISKITEVINQIAGQTRILSLNASIEAARVGDAGKGFGVVATQISALAEEITSEAKQINESITDSINLAMQSDNTIQTVAKLMDSVYDSSQQMADISSRVSQEIGRQGEEIEFMNDVVKRISLIANENSQTANLVMNRGNEMKKQSESLGELLNWFQFEQ